MSDPANYRRPSSVLVAQLLFWLGGSLILAVQMNLGMKKGILDWPSYATAAVLLFAGFLGIARCRAAVTYYVGGIAMIVLTVRAGFTAWTFVQLQHHNSQLPQVAPAVGIIAILLAWLTFVYLFGKASRAYFSM